MALNHKQDAFTHKKCSLHLKPSLRAIHSSYLERPKSGCASTHLRSDCVEDSRVLACRRSWAVSCPNSMRLAMKPNIPNVVHSHRLQPVIPFRYIFLNANKNEGSTLPTNRTTKCKQKRCPRTSPFVGWKRYFCRYLTLGSQARQRAKAKHSHLCWNNQAISRCNKLVICSRPQID